MDTQDDYQRADQSVSALTSIAMSLLSVLLFLAASPAYADCGRADGGLPTLPMLTPAQDGTMTLAIRAERSSVPVMIGGLPVADVPVFLVQPEAGTRLRAVDPFGQPGNGLPEQCLTAPGGLYAGSMWALRQGDRLRVHLTSALDFRKGELPAPPAGGTSCDGINLHTHGLLVSSEGTTEPDGSRSIGDQPFDIAVPPDGDESGKDPCTGAGGMADMAMGADMHHRIVPGALAYSIQIPGRPGQSGRGDGEHPSGLFWFHPHTHGYSASLTAGGMTGLMSIGALSDYLCVEVSGSCAAQLGIPVRTLVLKDAEIVPDRNGWRLAHERIYALEDACTRSPGRDDERRGECRDYRGRRWLFTVNGARYPSIDDVSPVRGEIWRIVNASPNMSYRLRLRPIADERMTNTLPLRVLTLEGAAPAPDQVVGPEAVKELLLMPASRAEILIVPPTIGGTFILEQQATSTGGDSWPRALLAELRIPATTAGAKAAAPVSGLRLRALSSTIPPQHFYGPTARPACDYPMGSVRRIQLVAKPSFSDDRRRPTKFGLIASLDLPNGPSVLFDADGRPQPMSRERWNALLAHDPDAPAFMHNSFGSLCTYLGHTETWIIENYTAEAHNFHIHQTEFRLAEAYRNNPAFFSSAPFDGLGTPQRATDAAIAASDAIDRAGDGASVYRDTVPVPRGVSTGGRGCDGAPFNTRCRPGRITVFVRFDRDAQIGTFVYHCHILQHEDAGMMAVIQVLCPPGDAACAERHQASPSAMMAGPQGSGS